MQDFVQASLQLQLPFQDGHEDIDADGDPYLGFHGVVARTVESFDPQMLFDPFEKQFDLPAAFVQPRDDDRGQCEVVREKHQPAFVFGVVKRNASKWIGVQLCRLHARQDDRLIAPQSGRFVHLVVRPSLEIEIAYATRDKKRRARREAVQPLEIHIAAIHYIERADFEEQLIEHVHIVHFSRGNVDETGNVAAEVEKRVQLHSALATTKLGPRKQTQAQVDGRGIERVNRLFEFHIEWIVDIQLASAANQHLREVGEDSPIVNLIGVGQSAARNLAANARVIQLRTHRSQTGFDVAKTFAKRQLRESQTQKLIATRKLALTFVAGITTNTLVEFVPGQELHELSEHQRPIVHTSTSHTWKPESRADCDVAS